MTTTTVTAEWLARRAAADDAARSRRLAAALSRLIGPGPVTVHDLGSGTGSMARWTAPRLPGPQRWVLHDRDAGILAQSDLRSVVDGAGRPVVSDVRIADLADLGTDAFNGASAVTASALLDVITEAEAERIAMACVAAGVPAFMSLTVTGRASLSPADELDAEFNAAFNEHQRRNEGGRRLLGPQAVPVVTGLFRAAGWHVGIAHTPWRLGPGQTELVLEWLDGWLGAAVEQRPELAGAAEQFSRLRRYQAAAGTLRVTLSHEDVLAWPH